MAVSAFLRNVTSSFEVVKKIKTPEHFDLQSLLNRSNNFANLLKLTFLQVRGYEIEMAFLSILVECHIQ